MPQPSTGGSVRTGETARALQSLKEILAPQLGDVSRPRHIVGQARGPCPPEWPSSPKGEIERVRLGAPPVQEGTHEPLVEPEPRGAILQTKRDSTRFKMLQYQFLKKI
jgi:hypothetical protein